MNGGAIMSSDKGLPICLLMVGLVLALASIGGAQQQLGAVQGTIADATGGVVAGATVTATNLRSTLSAFGRPAGRSASPALWPTRAATSMRTARTTIG
jgi:hypothetical protein